MNKFLWTTFTIIVALLVPAPGLSGEPVPEFVREMQDARKFVYKSGGSDPMVARTESREPGPDKMIAVEEGPAVVSKTPAPPEEKTPGQETAAGLFAEFTALNLRVDNIIPSPEAPAAVINGRLYHNGDVLSRERPEGDLTVDSIEPHGVLFKFKSLIVHVGPM